MVSLFITDISTTITITTVSNDLLGIIMIRSLLEYPGQTLSETINIIIKETSLEKVFISDDTYQSQVVRYFSEIKD